MRQGDAALSTDAEIWTAADTARTRAPSSTRPPGSVGASSTAWRADIAVGVRARLFGEVGDTVGQLVAGQRPLPEHLAQAFAELAAHPGDLLIGAAAVRAGHGCRT